jgi:nitrogen regulatory protein P-II 1
MLILKMSWIRIFHNGVDEMKKIEAVIKPDMFSSVKHSLAKAGYTSLTAYDVKGRGKQSGIIVTVGGKSIKADILPKIKIEIVVKDEAVEEVVETIIRTAISGSIGDSKIFILPVDDAIRIRTHEYGNDAI